MVAWVALILSLLALCLSISALMFAAYIYHKGTKIKLLDPDELFDLLLEKNDENILFKEEPYGD